MYSRQFLSMFGFILFAMLLSACATKKYVRQEVLTAKSELSARVDEEASRRAQLDDQVRELASLNKRNRSRIEQVNSGLTGAIKELDPKIEDARDTGTQAQQVANLALRASKENSDALTNWTNYELLMSRDVLFQFGSSALDHQARTTLKAIADVVKANNNSFLEVKGFTDSTGNPATNLRISNKRVDGVVLYLVGSLELDLHRIHSLGMGEENPVADNSTPDGRHRNRRVTITVMGKK